MRALQLLGRRLQEPVDTSASCPSRAAMQCPRIAECTNVPLQPEARPASPPIPRAIGQGIKCMIDKDPHTLDPPLKRLGVSVFDLGELREREGVVLGRGAFGVVRSIEGYPGLAVKEIRLDGLGESALWSLRFELATLTTFTHPGILRYRQIIEDEVEEAVHVVMDRYHGDLKEFIADHTRNHTLISKELLLSIMRQLADALAYLHDPTKLDSCGRSLPAIVHRDLKPANILVSEDGNKVVLADLGLCKSAMASGSTRAGSPAYMAPEVFIHRKTTPASDIWALGVIVYELATLKRPNFLGDKEPRHVFIDGWVPDLSPIEDTFIKSILEKIFILDPKKRPTAKELAEMLHAPNCSPRECGSHIATSEATLDNANARIAALENERSVMLAEIHVLKKELKTKSAKIDALEQQLADAIKHLAKLSCLIPIKDSSWTPLMRAAFIGDLEAARRHLSDRDKKNNKGETALMIAAKMGRADIVELIDPTDWNGVTALMRAADRNDVEAVRVLIPLQKGRTAGYVRINGWVIFHGTALMRAVACGHIKVIELLVEPEGGMQDVCGRTALMFAARSGYVECVKLLLEKEARMRDIYSCTALVYAVRAGHREIAELLIEHEKDVTGWTMLMCAAVLGDVDMVSQYINERGQKDKQGRTALILGAQRGRDEAVKFLMKHESGVSSWTSLICAAYLGDVDVVRDSLHETGCKDITGETALMWAAYRGRREVVRILVEEEGGMQRNDGWTALMFAAREGQADCIRVLLDKEGGMQRSNGWTALMLGAYNGHSGCVKLLLEKEVGIQNKDGWSALMWAAARGHEQIVELLKEEGGMKDKNGLTALMFAAILGHTECARILAEREKEITHARGITALDFAKLISNNEIVSILSG